jgi:hypothetical protein
MHEFQLRYRGGQLAVTCSCLLTRVRGKETQARNKAGTVIGSWRPSYWRRDVIEARTRFPAAEALAAYRAWHDQQGIEVAA